MTVAEAVPEIEDLVRSWIEDNWDPNLTLGEWWQRLADSGFAHPMLPTNAGGKGWSQGQHMRAMRAIASADVVGPPPGLGYMLAAPTIAEHGTAEQIERYIPPILNGREAWCQLFSEPVAGSDLAGLQTRATADGDEWLISGQKVWTSQGNYADLGMLIARTDPDLPKHRGLSYFAMPMLQDGVDVRPLREMTGRTFFSEVFMDNARVGSHALIGQRGDGWRIANTTLAVERASIGGGSAGFAMAVPGSRADQFDRRVGDIVERSKKKKGGGYAPGVGSKLFERYRQLAQRLGRTADPVLRQEMIVLYSLLQVNRLNIHRGRERSQRTGGEGNIAKLMDSEINRQFRDVSLRIIGADGMLAARSSQTDPTIAEVVLNAQGPPIYGGTDQIQRNILGERVLGLPKEPGPEKNTPFSQLPRNV